MKTLTKSQLLSELEAARIEIQRLSAENETLRKDVGWHRRVVPAAEKQPTEFQRKLAAAKAQALATGQMVRV